MFLVGGMPWLIWGFCLPTVTLAHATFAINTVNHMFGSRRFDTIDESRNNALTAFFAVGEGWHNNHHRYQRAARNGFYWWEFDPTWYVIRADAAGRSRLGRSVRAGADVCRGAREPEAAAFGAIDHSPSGARPDRAGTHRRLGVAPADRRGPPEAPLRLGLPVRNSLSRRVIESQPDRSFC